MKSKRNKKNQKNGKNPDFFRGKKAGVKYKSSSLLKKTVVRPQEDSTREEGAEADSINTQ